jgi:hypothetical protein
MNAHPASLIGMPHGATGDLKGLRHSHFCDTSANPPKRRRSFSYEDSAISTVSHMACGLDDILHGFLKAFS